MPDEIKKVLLIALEGVGGSEVMANAEAGKLPNFRRLMTEGTTLARVVADASPASNWAALATGAHTATHGVIGAEPCQAQYLWQAASRASKKTVLLGYPASSLPEFNDEHPVELVKPASRDRSYYGRVAAYLRSSPDWDLAFVAMDPGTTPLHEADDALGVVCEAADAETLRVFVGMATGTGEALAILAGPGILAGKTIQRPVEVADLAPTICHLAELPVPAECEGGIVYQALGDPDAKTFELQQLRKNYERLRRSSGRGPMC